MAWDARVVTLFPELFPGTLSASVIGRALDDQLWSLKTVSVRDHAVGKHSSVDDTPAGGGPGMVMRADVMASAIAEARVGLNVFAPTLIMSPRGNPLTQDRVKALAKGPGAVVVCGRFEGIDQRVIDETGAEEISIGDYVLAGGEVAAMVVLEAAIRLLPGVLGAEASTEAESFEGGLLEYPQYTRPREWQGREIPEVLLGGNHAEIEAWRQAQARDLTQRRRPDLFSSEE